MERLAKREEEHGGIEEADGLGSRKVKSTKVEKDSSKRSWQWRDGAWWLKVETKVEKDSSKKSWQWRDGAWWLKVECGRLNSRQRREVRRSVRHAWDEEGFVLLRFTIPVREKTLLQDAAKNSQSIANFALKTYFSSSVQIAIPV